MGKGRQWRWKGADDEEECGGYGKQTIRNNETVSSA
jgi:hypothetical protein